MYRRNELGSVRWHPWRLRGENYALAPLGHDTASVPGKPPETQKVELSGTETVPQAFRAVRRSMALQRPSVRGGLRYLMGCGHRSLPNVTVCERGCLRAPEYPLARGIA